MGDAVDAPEQRVEGQLNAIACCVSRTDGTLKTSAAKRMAAGRILLTPESAFMSGQVEVRQLLHFVESDVVHLSTPYAPVTALLVVAFHEVLTEFFGRFLGEDDV